MKTTPFLLSVLITGLTTPNLGVAQPAITSQPKSQSVSLGATVTFRVTVTGNAPLAYQWRFKEADLPGATSSMLSLTNAQLTHAGDYQVVVTNSAGSVTSQPANLGIDTTFTKITTGSIVTEQSQFTFCAWGDYNNDGWLDLFVNSRETANLLYRNSCDGTFAKVTNANLVWFTGANHTGGLWGDYDNDGFLDLLTINGGVTGNGQNVLYRNVGDGTFNRLDPAGLGTFATRRGGFIGATWGDYDADGFLDVFVPDLSGRNYLYRNVDGTNFKEATATNGQLAALGGSGVASAWADYDNDQDLDLLVISQDGATTTLFHNDGQGQFSGGPISFRKNNSEMGGGWGDFDNDGDFDLFLADSPLTRLYANHGDGTFLQLTNQVSITEAADTYGADWGDYDNDGLLDLFLANGLAGNPPLVNALYRNLGNGTFEKILTGSLVNDQARSGFCAWGDYDNNGFLDLFVANGWGSSESNFLYRNNGNSHGWLKVRCVGTTSNRTGIGAKVRVRAVINGQLSTQLRQIASSNGSTSGSLEAHFGLGDATSIHTLRIEWPSGITQEFHDVSIRQTLTVTEPPRLQASRENNQLRLVLPGGKGFVYEVQSSTDLSNWKTVTTLTNTSGKLIFTADDLPQHQHLFYRAAVR